MKTYAIDDKVNTIMTEICQIMQVIFGGNFKKLVLYGSYARGEQDIYSDMDILALVDLDENVLRGYDYQIFDLTYPLTLQYGILLSVMTKSETHFLHWVDVVPFYENIRSEGIEFRAG